MFSVTKSLLRMRKNINFYNEIGKTKRRGYKPREKGEKSHAELKGPGEEKKAKMLGKGMKKQTNKTTTTTIVALENQFAYVIA